MRHRERWKDKYNQRKFRVLEHRSKTIMGDIKVKDMTCVVEVERRVFQRKHHVCSNLPE